MTKRKTTGRKPATYPGIKPAKSAKGLIANKAARERVCALVAEGMSLRQIAAMPGMPARSTIAQAIVSSESFADQYARATAARAELWAAEMIDIADDGSNDWYERETRSGGTVLAPDAEATQRSRLRVDTRKWLLSKVLPKVYGDRMQVAGDPDAPVRVDHTGAVAVTTPERLAALRAKLAGTKA